MKVLFLVTLYILALYSVSAVSYYPKCSSSQKSLAEALKSIGVDTNFKFRKFIASLNGIENYSGAVNQNIELLNKLKQGKLIKSNSGTLPPNTLRKLYYIPYNHPSSGVPLPPIYIPGVRLPPVLTPPPPESSPSHPSSGVPLPPITIPSIDIPTRTNAEVSLPLPPIPTPPPIPPIPTPPIPVPKPEINPVPIPTPSEPTTSESTSTPTPSYIPIPPITIPTIDVPTRTNAEVSKIPEIPIIGASPKRNQKKYPPIPPYNIPSIEVPAHTNAEHPHYAYDVPQILEPDEIVIPPPGTKTKSKNDIAIEIYTFFKGKGWSKNAICGLIGNMDVESSLDPKYYRSDIEKKDVNFGRYGLIQYKPFAELKEWAGYNGLDYKTVNAQCLRIEYDYLANMYYRVKNCKLTFGQYIKSNKSPEELAECLMYNYVRPTSPRLDFVRAKARDWCKYL